MCTPAELLEGKNGARGPAKVGSIRPGNLADLVVVNADPTWNKTPPDLTANTVSLVVNGEIVVTVPVSGNAGIEDLTRAFNRLTGAAEQVMWDNLFPGWNGARFG